MSTIEATLRLLLVADITNITMMLAAADAWISLYCHEFLPAKNVTQNLATTTSTPATTVSAMGRYMSPDWGNREYGDMIPITQLCYRK